MCDFGDIGRFEDIFDGVLDLVKKRKYDRGYRWRSYVGRVCVLRKENFDTIDAKRTRDAFDILHNTYRTQTGGRLWDDSGHCVCDSRKKTMIVPYDDFDVSPVVRLVISDNRHYSTVCWIHANAFTTGGGRGALHLSSCGRVTFYESYDRILWKHSRALSSANDDGFEGEKY